MPEVNPTIDDAPYDEQSNHINFKKSSVIPGFMDKRNKRQ